MFWSGPICWLFTPSGQSVVTVELDCLGPRRQKTERKVSQSASMSSPKQLPRVESEWTVKVRTKPALVVLVKSERLHRLRSTSSCTPIADEPTQQQ